MVFNLYIPSQSYIYRLINFYIMGKEAESSVYSSKGFIITVLAILALAVFARNFYAYTGQLYQEPRSSQEKITPPPYSSSNDRGITCEKKLTAEGDSNPRTVVFCDKAEIDSNECEDKIDDACLQEIRQAIEDCETDCTEKRGTLECKDPDCPVKSSDLDSNCNADECDTDCMIFTRRDGSIRKRCNIRADAEGPDCGILCTDKGTPQ